MLYRASGGTISLPEYSQVCHDAVQLGIVAGNRGIETAHWHVGHVQGPIVLAKQHQAEQKEFEEDSSPSSYLFEMPLVPLPTVLQAGQVELRLLAHAELLARGEIQHQMESTGLAASSQGFQRLARCEPCWQCARDACPSEVPAVTARCHL